MNKKYPFQLLPVILAAIILFSIASCKKVSNTVDNNVNSSNTLNSTTATPVKLPIFESDSDIYKLLFMEVSKIGNQNVNYDLVFDTGSGGLVIDANGILPASMITSNGFNFTGDSTIVDGITITSEESVVEYGDDSASITKVYGNLAYAPVTIGDANGNVVVTRLPFFIYYKGVDANGNLLPQHYFDVLGVSPEYDITFSNNAFITSPFSYYTPGTGLTKGFKIAALGTSNFSEDGTYVPGVVTVGLTATDISSASGFTTSPLLNAVSQGDGYLPYVSATVTYKSKNVSTYLLFDSGTEPYSYIEDKTATGLSLLPTNTPVSVLLASGFTYNYTTTAKDNLTYIENPTTSGADISIISLEYFLTGEYMINFASNTLGLKNN